MHMQPLMVPHHVATTVTCNSTTTFEAHPFFWLEQLTESSLANGMAKLRHLVEVKVTMVRIQFDCMVMQSWPCQSADGGPLQPDVFVPADQKCADSRELMPTNMNNDTPSHYSFVKSQSLLYKSLQGPRVNLQQLVAAFWLSRIHNRNKQLNTLIASCIFFCSRTVN